MTFIFITISSKAFVKIVLQPSFNMKNYVLYNRMLLNLNFLSNWTDTFFKGNFVLKRLETYTFLYKICFHKFLYVLKRYITKLSSAVLLSSSGNNPEQHVKARLWTCTRNAMTWGLSNTPELTPNSLHCHDPRVVCCQWKSVTINSITQLSLYPCLFWDLLKTVQHVFFQ